MFSSAIKYIIFFCLILLLSCSEKTKDTLFVKRSSAETNIDFKNFLQDKEGFDVFRYRNYYNGGGVGVGDLNNDSLPDIYFISNEQSNRLYFNKGDFEFEDVTEKSKAGGTKPWSTGVNLVDINSDGWLDIYVSNSGDPQGENRANELFINNHDSTFSEEAAKYGLDDKSFTTHAAFFDYDQDGDLDCYLVNNSFRPASTVPRTNMRDQRDKYGGDKFYENQDGKYIDISEQAGIYGNVAGLGLAVTLVDVNNDGWTDIYVSNDFFERDYLYINKQGQGFKEELEKYFDQVSLAAMGGDAADINNDGLSEVFVTEMLPESDKRMKQVTSFESFELFNYKKDKGFYNQFQRNTLQLNNGDGTFSEIGRHAGVYATDWSWGALIFDMNNSGNKEIFVTNGIYKDLTDQDFLAYFGKKENLQAARKGIEVVFNKFVDRMPSTPLTNYVFEQDSALMFKNQAQEWGFGTKSFSNGLAYGDLDNDGDLDLVINNLNQQAFIYENRSTNQTNNHYVAVRLKGAEGNSFGIGAKIIAYRGKEKITVENYPSRSFRSSVDYKMILGVGTAEKIDSLDILWNAVKRSRYYNVPADTLLTASISEASNIGRESKKKLKREFAKVEFNHRHRENEYNDFSNYPLLFHELSKQGPALAQADINDDGRDDFFIGGAAGSAGKIFLNKGDDSFVELSTSVFEKDLQKEDVDATFFDADGDGDQDLYIVSGGNEQPGNLRRYEDRLYLHNGSNAKPDFVKSEGLPQFYDSGSVVKPADFDNDGDIDLFVGSRSIPGEYGKPASSHLLENDGTGRFKNVTATYITQLNNIGLVTDAAWSDYDNDGDLDLTIVGEWMPIVFFENRGDFFQRQFNIDGLERSAGWWYSIYPYDINKDGRMDYIAGNLGTNSIFKASKENPVRLFINDFDKNNSLDYIYTFKKDGKFVPYQLRDELAQQLGMIKSKFPDYKSYNDKSVEDIFSKQQLTGAIQLTAYNFSSAIIMNKGNGTFTIKPLPPHAQFSPIFSIQADDFNGDGNDEILLVGNYSGTKPHEGYYDANHGLVYSIREGGKLKRVSSSKTGLNLRGDIQEITILNSSNNKYLVVGKNNDKTGIYSFKK